MVSRRQFVRSSVVSTAGLLAGLPLASLVGCSSERTMRSGPYDDRFSRRVFADLHCHPLIDEWNSKSPLAQSAPFLFDIVKKVTNPTTIDWQKCHDAGIDMMCVAHFNVFDEWVSMPTDPNPDALAHTIRMMNLLEEKLNRISSIATIVKNARQLKEHLLEQKTDSYKIAVVHCLEGGHAMGMKPGVVQELAEKGVAAIEIIHFYQKGIGSAVNSFPFFYDEDAPWPYSGLTKEGIDIIHEMNSCGMIVDVCHSTSTSIKDVLRESRAPIIASHASARALGDHPYGLTDEHLKAIAQNGGIVGAICEPWWASNFATNTDAEKKGSIDDIIRTIEYFLKICGVDHVGIGSDFAGYITAPNDLTELGDIHKLRDHIIAEFGIDVTEKIMATNVINFFIENWGRSA